MVRPSFRTSARCDLSGVSALGSVPTCHDRASGGRDRDAGARAGGAGGREGGDRAQHRGRQEGDLPAEEGERYAVGHRLNKERGKRFQPAAVSDASALARLAVSSDTPIVTAKPSGIETIPGL